VSLSQESGAPAAALSGATPRRLWALRLDTRRLRLLAIAYGLAVGVYAAFHLTATVPNNFSLMPMRANGIAGSISVLNHGGPPLLSAFDNVADTYPQINRTQTYTYFPLPRSDDAGIYLYAPLLSRATGETNPQILVKWLFVGLFVLALAIWPLAFLKIFGSAVAAAVTPLLLLFEVVPHLANDIYWVQAWAVLFALPPLLALRRHTTTNRWLLGALPIIVLAGAASSVRGHSGLPALLAALAIALFPLGPRNWRRRMVGVLTVLVVYGIVTVGVIDLARAIRNHQVRHDHVAQWVAPDIAPTPTGWHVLYIGLGYLPNRYGITYSDSSGAIAVRRVNPKIEYLGPQYRREIRHLYLRIVKHDPGFVAKTYLVKAQSAFLDGFHRYWWGLLATIAMLLLARRRRRQLRGDVALLVPALVVMLVPPVVSLPLSLSFEAGWIGATALVWVVGLGWLASLAGAATSEALGSTTPRLPRWDTLLQPPARPDPRSWQPWVAVGAAVVLGAFLIGPLADKLSSLRARHDAVAFYQADLTPLSRPPLRPATPVRSWNLVPRARPFKPYAGVDLTASSTGVRVDTNKGQYQYQLLSPVFHLSPGRYEVRLRGRVLSGGLELGVLDAAASTWINTTNFWSGQAWARGGLMTNDFDLEKKQVVQVILTNFASSAKSSRWLLRQIDVVRLGE
jgi:hypothetical protein